MEERQLEREDKQRREDRLFQMQMMRMMMGSGAYHFPPPSNHPSLGHNHPSLGQSNSWPVITSFNICIRLFEYV